MIALSKFISSSIQPFPIGDGGGDGSRSYQKLMFDNSIV